MRGLCVDGYSNEGWMPILKGIDLTLRRGEILGLIGESGAGKSTLGAAARDMFEMVRGSPADL